MQKMFYLLLIKSQSDQPLQMIFFMIKSWGNFTDTCTLKIHVLFISVMVTSFITAHTAYRSFNVLFLTLKKTFIHCFVTDVQPLYEHEYNRQVHKM